MNEPMPTTMYGHAKQAEGLRDERETPVHKAIERINKLMLAAIELTSKLEQNADIAFGPVPEDNCKSADCVKPGGSSLMTRLSIALDDLEEANSRLAQAIGRNCWAV